MRANRAISGSRLLVLILIFGLLSACLTLPGHRQTIKEDNFELSITAPSEQVKREIRFNKQQTKLLELPMEVSIELYLLDKYGKHELSITNVSGFINYDYHLNGRKVPFDRRARTWFTDQIPRIIKASSLNTDQETQISSIP